MDKTTGTNANYYAVLDRLKIANQYAKIDAKLFNKLQEPEQITKGKTLNINGKKKPYTWLRSRHTTFPGPAKGGVRYDKSITEDEIKTFSLLMTLKNAVIGNDNFGGGKGGIAINPKTIDEEEIKAITYAYIEALGNEIGPDIDILAPDIGTDSKIMQWMIQAYQKLHPSKQKPYATVTGKPLKRRGKDPSGGILGRTEATGYGIGIVTEAAIDKGLLGIDKKEIKIAIEGFGNVGQHTAEYLTQKAKHNYKIVAISDRSGWYYNEKSIDIKQAIEIKKAQKTNKNRSLQELAKNGTKKQTKDSIITSAIDILIPAADQNTINEHNAPDIKAKLIVEGANNAITSQAYEMLLSRENPIVSIPGILANAGGVRVSYFEYQQNIHNTAWTLQKVNNNLEKSMKDAFNQVYKIAHEIFDDQNIINLHLAADILALRRLDKVYKNKRQHS